MYPSHLTRWWFVGIPPILSEVETEKKIQTLLRHFTSNTSFMHTEYQLSSTDRWYLA